MARTPASKQAEYDRDGPGRGPVGEHGCKVHVH